VLLSVLRQENIDYENDFYWLNKFQKERMRDPSKLERSLQQSRAMMMSSSAAQQSVMDHDDYEAEDALQMDSSLFIGNDFGNLSTLDDGTDKHQNNIRNNREISQNVESV
jgi:hypothetical protein